MLTIGSDRLFSILPVLIIFMCSLLCTSSGHRNGGKANRANITRSVEHTTGQWKEEQLVNITTYPTTQDDITSTASSTESSVSPILLVFGDESEQPDHDEQDNTRFVPCDPYEIPSPCKSELLEVCRQVNGMYRCLCPENISRTSRGKCTVFNECFEKSTNNCSQNAYCVDLEEGYTCHCKPGYRDDSPNPTELVAVVCEPDSPSGQFVNAPSETTQQSTIHSSITSQSTSPSTPPLEPIKNREKATIVSSAEGQSSLLTRKEENGRIEQGADQRSLVAATLNAFHKATKGQDASQLGPASFRPLDELNRNLQWLDSSSTAPPLTRPTLQEVFKSFDLDQNELVDFDELKSTVNFYSLKINERQIRRMITAADTNGEGLVDINEFLTIMTR